MVLFLEYQLAERMIKAFVKNAIKRRRIWGRPNVCVTIPVGITEVERRAVEDAVVRTGAREIFLLESPIASLHWELVLISWKLEVI